MQKSLLTELKAKGRSSCSCCPYGFHIDRDFVQYCESIYNNAQLDKRKQEKRDNRKKHRSVESYLGLEACSIRRSDTKEPAVPNGYESSEKEALNALDGVMQDFESTWIQSSSKRPSGKVVESGQCRLKNSIEGYLKDQNAIPINKLTDKGSRKAVLLSRDMLEKIREQISVSLKRTKELEAQVKSIPHLQVKLLVLDKERQELLTKLNNVNIKQSVHSVNEESLTNNVLMLPDGTSNKCVQANFSLNRPCINSSSSSTQTFSDNCLKHGIKDFDGKSSFYKNIESNVKKDVSTSCSVLTRDIGVGHIQNKVVSTGVGRKNVFSSSCFLPDNGNVELEKSESSDSIESGSDVEKCFKLEFSSVHPISFNSNLNRLKENETFSEHETKLDPKEIHSFQERNEKKIVPTQVFDRSQESKAMTTDLQMTDLVAYDKWKFKRENFLHGYSFELSKAVQTDTCISSSTMESVSSIISHEDSMKHMYDIKLLENTIESGEKHLAGAHTPCSKSEIESKGVGDIDINEFICFLCSEKSHARALTHSLRMRSVGTNTVECYPNFNTFDDLSQNVSLCESSFQMESSCIFPKCRDKKVRKTSGMLTVSSDSDSESVSTTVETLNIFSENFIKNRCDTVNSSSESANITERNLGINQKMVDDEKLQWCSLENTDEWIVLSKEVKAACKVLNDHLLKADGECPDEKGANCLAIIQNEWFSVANQKNADPHIIERYLDSFEEFSEKLLHRVVNLADSNGNTAVHYAVSYSNFDVVSILIDSKVCDVNKRNKAGYTCIMLVALAEMNNDAHYLVVQRLFHMGDINIKASQNGQTALMLAVSHGKIEIVKMLLEAGAEVNLQDNDGSTALMCAAEHGHIDIVRQLLSHPDCDSTIVDSDGSNALTIAMEAGNKDIGLLIYANMNFSRGNSPHAVVKQRIRTMPRARTPTLQTFRPPSPSARSTCSLPSAFQLS